MKRLYTILMVVVLVILIPLSTYPISQSPLPRNGSITSQMMKNHVPSQPWLHNIETGMQNWRVMRDAHVGWGRGGVFVEFIGDSTTEGAYLANQLSQQYSEQVIRILQRKYNPINPTTKVRVPGGLGFKQMLNSDNTPILLPGLTKNGIWTDPGALIPGLRMSPPDTGYLDLLFNSTSDAYSVTAPDTMPAVTGLEFVVAADSSVFGPVTISYSENGGAFTYVEQDLVRPSIAGTMAGQACTVGIRADGTGLTKSGGFNYPLNVRIERSDTSKYIDVMGIYHYNGDEFCGVKCINLGISSTFVRQWIASTVDCGSSKSGVLNSAKVGMIHGLGDPVNSWYPLAQKPANKYVGCVVINLCINDYEKPTDVAASSPTPIAGTPSSVYQNALDALVQAIIAARPQASILLVIPTQVYLTADDAHTYRYAEFRREVYAVMSRHMAQVAICDLYQASGFARRVTTPFGANESTTINPVMGINGLTRTDDKIHPTYLGAAKWASWCAPAFD